MRGVSSRVTWTPCCPLIRTSCWALGSPPPGPPHNPLSDYARKMWSGLIRSYHLNGRWGKTIDAALAVVRAPSPQPYNATAVAAAIDAHETAWQTNYSEVFPTNPVAEALPT